MILELVSFRLRPGVEQGRFEPALAAVDDFLAGQPGFLSRQVFRADDGTWFDLVRWRDLDSARNAAAAIRSDDRCRDFLDCLDPASVTMTHAQLVRSHELSADGDR